MGKFQRRRHAQVYAGLARVKLFLGIAGLPLALHLDILLGAGAAGHGGP